MWSDYWHRSGGLHGFWGFDTDNFIIIFQILSSMKKYTITIFAILGILALVYVATVIINSFMLANTLSKPVVAKMNFPEGGQKVEVVAKNAIDIKLIGNHQFVYKTINLTESKPLDIDSQIFIKEIKPIIKKIGKNETVIKLLVNSAAEYKDVVDMLDLLALNNIKKYAILEDNISPKK
jgi:biopolymer transport protein ExbD